MGVYTQRRSGQAHSAFVRQRAGYLRQDEQTGAKNDAFVAFVGTPEGPLRLAEYDRVICDALLTAFGKRTTNSIMKMYESVKIHVNGSRQIFDDVITFVGSVSTISHDLGEIGELEMEQVIEVLNGLHSKHAPALGVGMITGTKGKGYSVERWCEISVEKASQRIKATDEFADWVNKSKGNQPVADADRLDLNNLRKEVVQLKKENAQFKATKQSN